MSFPYFEYVQRAHADLLAEGLIGPRTNQDAVEQDKGLLTRRAGFYINSERDGSIGLLEKTSGNNSLGYSVDWLVRNSDGTGWDVATDDGTQALPSNGGPYPPDPANIERWRKPTAELAQYSGAPPDPEPGPDPTPPPVDRTDEVLAAIAASEARTHDAIAADGNETRDLIRHYAEQVDTWATIILAAWLKLNAPTTPTGDAIDKVKRAIAAIRDADDRP